MKDYPEISGLPIGGAWMPVRETLPVVNPATGGLVGHAPVGGIEHNEAALAAARSAFAITRRQPPHERASALLRIARGLESRRDDLVRTIVAESGKPVTPALAEVERAIATFTAAAEESRRLPGELIPMEAFASGQGHMGFARRFPIGVIYALTPFNFPLNLVAHKIAPCIATGNTMVLKPAPKTPFTALLLAEILESAGTIAGQVNMVVCDNANASHLVGDPRVAMTSFTGSPAVGWRLKERCGRQKICLELGGNAAVVVHSDADLDKAVPSIAAGCFAYAGQSCISVQRILVHEAVIDAFRGRFLEHIRKHVVMGDPADPCTVLGPMIDAGAAGRVRSWIDAAVRSGARIIAGGGGHGSFVEPSVLEGVDPSQDICAREAFAPVAVLSAYRDFDHALDTVNDSDFGLQAGVFTADIQRAFRAYERLEVGAVMINNVPTFRVENMPYGGIKGSGFGREGLRYAMEEMTELKSLILKLE